MVPLKIALIALCLACAVFGQAPDPETTTPSSTSSTTEKSTTTTSTTEKPTTTTTTTTTTEKSTTTTTTTTQKSTTTSSTTPGPITTKKPPTPTPAPTPGEYNTTCIKVKFAAQLNFTYETVDGHKQNVLYNLPPNMTADADCLLQATQSIALHWMDEDTKIVNSMTLHFGINNTLVSLDQIFIKLEPNLLFPDANNESIQLVYSGKSLFGVPQNRSYHCTRDDKIGLAETINNINNTIGYVTFSKVQMEAFHVEKDKNSNWSFSTVMDCEAKTGSDVVPIAVGIALCVLIVIVLISYLVARRRSAVRGYMSF